MSGWPDAVSHMACVPEGVQHDVAVHCSLLENEDLEFQPSPFFSEQLTAFELWLEHGSSDKKPPEQLPIVLQVCTDVIADCTTSHGTVSLTASPRVTFLHSSDK